MSTIDYSVERIQCVLRTIDSLQGSEFPYDESKAALDKVDNVFQQTASLLADTKSFADQDGFEVLVQTVCAESLETSFNYLPLLGFILRSTNVRNAFEVHGPVSRLAQKLLGVKTKLLVSSEWDYSPSAYSDIPGLESFILLGLPSPESSNPLLIPLAGHELGHALWSIHNLTNTYDVVMTKSIQDDIDGDKELLKTWQDLYKPPSGLTDRWSDIIVSSTISPSSTWAVRQAEETFCDLVGLRVFGQAFLHAFAYLLCPGEEYRSVEYPSVPTRIKNLLKVASDWGIPFSEDYESQFMPRSSPPPFVEESSTGLFQLQLADRALLGEVDRLMHRAETYATEKGIALPDMTIINTIRSRFDLTVPCEDSKELGNILNAAWNAYHDDKLWSDCLHIPADIRKARLKELVLKNIEILDIEQMKGESS